MQKSSFFNSVGGDRKYKAEEWAEYFASFIGNGVFPTPSSNLAVYTNVDMTINVKAGKVWINGYFFNNTSDLVMQLPTADGVLKRIDRIVVRWSLTTRDISIVVKKGTPLSNPTAPALQRDADVYELTLADIQVNNGAIQLTQANITDQRWNTSLCGVVAGTVEQIDATFITAQFNSFFAQYKKLILDEYAAYCSKSTEEYENYVNLITEQYALYETYLLGLKNNSQTDYGNLIAWFANFKTQSTADFTAWFDSTKTQYTTDFTTWFNGIKGMLEGDIATNFSNEISSLKENVNTLTSETTTIKNDISSMNTSLSSRVKTIEDYIQENLRFSNPAYLSNSYLGSTYLTATI